MGLCINVINVFLGMWLDIRAVFVTLTQEAGIPQNQFYSFSAGNHGYLEALSIPGPYGSVSTSGATGSCAHVSGSKGSLAPGTLPTETPAGHSAAHQEAVCVVGKPQPTYPKELCSVQYCIAR